MVLAVVVAASTVAVVPAPPANAATSPEAFEYCLLQKANQERASRGLPQLEMAYELIPPVRDWSRSMRYNGFAHMQSSYRLSILPSDWTAWGENIAMHPNSDMADCSTIHQMWMNSSGHRANILGAHFRYAAFGAYVDSSGWWATQLFFDANNYQPQCDGTFCDDDFSIFEGDIEKIADAGITQGCNPPVNNRFCPDDYVTRGVMAAFLVRALGLTDRGNVDFVDDNNSIFETDIEKLAAAGITKGCNPPSNTRFCPDDFVTREVMAAFLVRALDLDDPGNIDFVDDDSSMFEADINKLATAGITHGCNPPANDHFCPDDRVTRGAMAAFLARALNH